MSSTYYDLITNHDLDRIDDGIKGVLVSLEDHYSNYAVDRESTETEEYKELREIMRRLASVWDY